MANKAAKPTMKAVMIFGSLFAGIGGFDLGFERASMKCAWQCEIDNAASTTLAKHWPNVVRIGDIRRFDASKRQWTCDVLCGGFPCQDVSLCGNMAGLDGGDSRLFWEFARVAEEAGPKWIILENVPGLLTGNQGRDLFTVIRALGQRGYICAYRIFDAKCFVPQSRPRLFIVGHLGDWTGPARVLFDAECLRESAGQSLQEQDRLGRAINDGAPFVFQTRAARCKRGLPSAIIPTLTSYAETGLHGDSQPHVVTDQGIRRLTPLECERAMGFPDEWTSGLHYRERWRLLGNAVVPAVAEWIGKRLVAVAEN